MTDSGKHLVLLKNNELSGDYITISNSIEGKYNESEINLLSDLCLINSLKENETINVKTKTTTFHGWSSSLVRYLSSENRKETILFISETIRLSCKKKHTSSFYRELKKIPETLKKLSITYSNDKNICNTLSILGDLVNSTIEKYNITEIPYMPIMTSYRPLSPGIFGTLPIPKNIINV